MNGLIFVVAAARCTADCIDRLASHAHFANGETWASNSLLSSIEWKQRPLTNTFFFRRKVHSSLSTGNSSAAHHGCTKRIEAGKKMMCKMSQWHIFCSKNSNCNANFLLSPQRFYHSKMIAFFNAAHHFDLQTHSIYLRPHFDNTLCFLSLYQVDSMKERKWMKSARKWYYS